MSTHTERHQQGTGLPADGLSRKEVLELSGLAVERLGIWYNRKLLSDEFRAAHSGRGNRTRFTIKEAYFLLLTRLLVDKGLPISGATGKLSTQLMAFFGFTKFDLQKAEAHLFAPVLIVPSVYDGEFVMEPISTLEEMVKFLRVRKLRTSIILDINEAYLDFRHSLAEIIANR